MPRKITPSSSFPFCPHMGSSISPLLLTPLNRMEWLSISFLIEFGFFSFFYFNYVSFPLPVQLYINVYSLLLFIKKNSRIPFLLTEIMCLIDTIYYLFRLWFTSCTLSLFVQLYGCI